MFYRLDKMIASLLSLEFQGYEQMVFQQDLGSGQYFIQVIALKDEDDSHMRIAEVMGVLEQLVAKGASLVMLQEDINELTGLPVLAICPVKGDYHVPYKIDKEQIELN